MVMHLAVLNSVRVVDQLFLIFCVNKGTIRTIAVTGMSTINFSLEDAPVDPIKQAFILIQINMN